MQEAQEMTTRDKQINFRVSEEEGARFDRVAAHYGLPVSAVIRMLVKERDGELENAKQQRARGEDDFKWRDYHHYILRAIETPSGDPLTKDEIWEELENVCSRNSEGSPNLTNALIHLHRNGYLRRTQSGYSLSDKGKALVRR